MFKYVHSLNLQRKYYILLLFNFQFTDLFPYDENASAVVARVSKEEFLLNAPGDLGMFVTSAGVSERPPIQWSKPAQKFVFCQPYVVAMSDDSIVVYR